MQLPFVREVISRYGYKLVHGDHCLALQKPDSLVCNRHGEHLTGTDDIHRSRLDRQDKTNAS